ncbi:DUF2007 domain-containing protein [Luteolibacter luteus]|uniref:DUF2007 domain-containing protein n=1 Tax=Luteolibacter luteus TaxID=2728835 RepID=A0A858RQR7_9BACT|nr:DUF2007 domain-containing protein [Luteolibacter luteus]QJE98728.1 DUF2007 domain-containing protein [Luteolibacter luteus]
MKLVFEHIDFTVVGHLKTVLEAEGIKAEVRNEGASGATGELPFAQVYPELWVLNNSDEARAKQIVKDYRNQEANAPVGPDWTCPVCKEHVEGVFTECWNCGAANPTVAIN